MSSRHIWQGDQRRPLPPDFENDFMRYPTATAFQDQQAGQVTQVAGELHSVASDQGQICNLPRSPMSSFGNTTIAGLPNGVGYDLADQDPGQHANGYQYHRQYHNPHQDPTQNSNSYLSDELNTHQGLVNYHTMDMEGSSEDFSEPSLTSFSNWGNQLGPSQPGATSQYQGRYSEHQTLLDPSSRSFAPAVPQYHEPKRYAPGDERPFSSCDEYHLRLGLAVGERFCDIALRLGRTEESVVGFSEQEGLFWTQEEDDVLRESMIEDYSPSCDAVNHLMENGRRFEEEIFKRAKAVALWDEAAREAEQAEIPKPQHRQSPASSQRSGSVETQSMIEEAGADIQQDLEEQGPAWTDKEMEILEEWKAQHPNTWEGVEKLLPGRTYAAYTHKWSRKNEVRRIRYDWSDGEFIRLKEWVAGHDRWPKEEELSEHFPHRDQKACKNKWIRDGTPWTDEEDKYLSSLQVREDTDWNKVAANTSMQPKRSGREAEIRHEYLEDCRVQLKSSKSLGGVQNARVSG